MWFEINYPNLQQIYNNVGRKTNKNLGDELHELFKGQRLDLRQVTLLNIYFGNDFIINQVIADVDLCLDCYPVGLPRSGLGLTRRSKNPHAIVRHAAKRPWSKNPPQQVDCVVIEQESGKYTSFDKVTGQIGVSSDRKNPLIHIPYKEYNRILHRPIRRCVCKTR